MIRGNGDSSLSTFVCKLALKIRFVVQVDLEKKISLNKRISYFVKIYVSKNPATKFTHRNIWGKKAKDVKPLLNL